MEHYKNYSLENIIEEVDGIVYTEEWKYINGYEGYYMISTFGRVKAVKRSVLYKDKVNFATKRERILKLNEYRKNGYLGVVLNKGRVNKKFIVHRLVGIHFIPNPENKPQINHLFGNKKDNRIKRIEWITRSDNEKHSYKVLLKKKSTTWVKNFNRSNSRPVMCTDTGEVFNSVTSAALKYNIDRKLVSWVCDGNKSYKNKLKFKYI